MLQLVTKEVKAIEAASESPLRDLGACGIRNCRVKVPALKWAFIRVQIAADPEEVSSFCERCGLATGSWREGCDKPCNFFCSFCEDEGRFCLACDPSNVSEEDEDTSAASGAAAASGAN